VLKQKSQIQVPLEFSPLIPLEQPARLNCLLWRAGLRYAPLHIIPWLILPPPHSVCSCTAESLLMLHCTLPSCSSWSSHSLCSSLTLHSVDGSSLVLSVVELWRACLCSASRSLRSSPRLMAPHWFSLWLYCESLLVLPLTLLYLPSTPRPAPSNTPG